MERKPDSNEGKSGVGFPLHYNIRDGSEWYDGVARYIVMKKGGVYISFYLSVIFLHVIGRP